MRPSSRHRATSRGPPRMPVAVRACASSVKRHRELHRTAYGGGAIRMRQTSRTRVPSRARCDVRTHEMRDRLRNPRPRDQSSIPQTRSTWSPPVYSHAICRADAPCVHQLLAWGAGGRGSGTSFRPTVQHIASPQHHWVRRGRRRRAHVCSLRAPRSGAATHLHPRSGTYGHLAPGTSEGPDGWGKGTLRRQSRSSSWRVPT